MKTTFVDQPVLYIINANPALIRRLNNEKYDFILTFQEKLPTIWSSNSALLLFYPDQVDFISLLPLGKSFIAYGDTHFMDEAFSLGAADYISNPLHIGEFKARLGRIFRKKHILKIPSSGISIEETTLCGPGGSCQLSPEEASLLRTLFYNTGEKVSRSALRDSVWPALPEKSRMVDTTVSQLRKYLKMASGNSQMLYIKTIHGFGYMVCEVTGN